MPTTGVVSRHPELAAIGEVVKAAGMGPSGLLFEGEPGIGKTALWQAAVTAATEAGMRILTSRPSQSESKLTFAGLADLLASVGDEVINELAEPQRQALEVALLRADPAGTVSDLRSIAMGFLSVLRLMSRMSPVLVAVDDVQWLDPSTWSVLEFAMRRLTIERVALIATLRIEGDGVARRPAELLPAERMRQIRLGGLNIAALNEILRARLAHTFTRPMLLRIELTSVGNPLFAIELARAMLESGEPDIGSGPLPVPGNLTTLLQRRLRKLSAASRRSLLAVAATSRPTLDLLDRASVAQAERAGVIRVEPDGRIAFTHPLLGSAIYSSATVVERREVHRDLAGVVTDGEERARHLALSANGPDESTADELEAAAARARLRGAPIAAAELLELAVALTPKSLHEQILLRTLSAAEDHFHAGTMARARALAERVVKESAPGSARGQALRLLGEIRYLENSFAEAIPLFEQALEYLRDDRHSVWVLVNLAYARVSLGDLPGAVSPARAAVEAATRSGDDALRAVALAVSAIVDWYLGQPPDWTRINLALKLEDAGLPIAMAMRPSLIAGVVLAQAGNPEEAANLLKALRQRTIERGEETELPLVGTQLAMAERYQGHLEASIQFATEGYEMATQSASPTMQTIALAERCLSRATAGDLRGAEADAEEATELVARTGYPLGFVWTRAAQGWLELSRGNIAAADGALEAVSQGVEARGFCDPLSAAFLPDKVETLVALGHLDRAEALSGLLERYSAGNGHRQAAVAARCTSLVLAARGKLGEALAAIQKSVDELGAVAVPVELGRALMLKGQIHRRRKEKLLARQALTRSAQIFESTGAVPLAARARAELTRIGLRPEASHQLTPTEERIAALAAAGLRNREIAQRVLLTPKTVEANLARIYQKLGIHSRAELGARVSEGKLLLGT